MGEWLQIIVTIMLSIMAGVAWLAFKYPKDFQLVYRWLWGISFSMVVIYTGIVMLLKHGAWEVSELVPYENLDAYNAKIASFEPVPINLCLLIFVIFNIFTSIVGGLSVYLNRSESEPSED